MRLLSVDIATQSQLHQRPPKTLLQHYTLMKSLAHNPLSFCGLAAGLSFAALSTTDAATIFAAGRNLSNPNYATGAYYYSIDTDTGVATPISPRLSTNGPNGIAVNGSQLVGFSGNTHGTIDPTTGTFTPIGSSSGFNFNGYDVLGGYGYGVPSAGTDRRLHRVDLTTSTAVAVGTGNPLVAAMDALYGTSTPNTPDIIAMGSVGNTLYGLNSGNGKFNLFSIDPLTGDATILGAANAVATSGIPGARYSGFSSLTGVDENGDGVYDALFGNINFFDPDGLTGPQLEQNFGGVIRFDLADGTWDLVGSNQGVIFFGFGSPIPEPSTTAMAGTLGLALAFRRRRSLAK